MHAPADKQAPTKTLPVNAAPQAETAGDAFAFADQRPEAVAQRRIREMAESFAAQKPVMQRMENTTGLPDDLQSGIENLSGYSMDDVKVHYNSDKPQQLNAHAYAQGTDIHVASGQEKHLPHEAWHVVQQKQGRVKATAQLKGIGVNDDTALEQEADTMGAKALTGSTGTAQLRAVDAARPVVQLALKESGDYINDNHLLGSDGHPLQNTRVAIIDYVNDANNDRVHRQGLRNAYNVRNGRWRIAAPANLNAPPGVPNNAPVVPNNNAPVVANNDEGLENWDSDNDDKMDLDQEIANTQNKSDLVRGRGKKEKKVPSISRFSLYKAIRIGRQIAKRQEYKKRLPLIMEIDGHSFEMSSPYNTDIYITPLNDESQDKSKPSNTYRRAGRSSQYNFKNLSKGLHKAHAKGAAKVAPELFNELMKPGKLKLSREAAEALGAIGADLMKGSFGARFYLRQAIRRIAEQEKAKKDSTTFQDVFEGKDPLYTPALKGGRGQVVDMNNYAHEVIHLLGVNDCLINAIAQAALGRNADIDELIQIRSELANPGEMMVAEPATINVIRRALRINNRIDVFYPKDSDGWDESFAGGNPPISIYHTGDEHFQSNCPDPDNYHG